MSEEKSKERISIDVRDVVPASAVEDVLKFCRTLLYLEEMNEVSSIVNIGEAAVLFLAKHEPAFFENDYDLKWFGYWLEDIFKDGNLSLVVNTLQNPIRDMAKYLPKECMLLLVEFMEGLHNQTLVIERKPVSVAKLIRERVLDPYAKEIQKEQPSYDLNFLAHTICLQLGLDPEDIP